MDEGEGRAAKAQDLRPQDLLRGEIEAGLNRPQVLVVPVLIGSTTMLDRDNLPESLVRLTECDALRPTAERGEDQVARLIRALNAVVRLRDDGQEAEAVPSLRLGRPLDHDRRGEQVCDVGRSRPTGTRPR